MPLAATRPDVGRCLHGPLDGSIVAVALPKMGRNLHLGFTASIWVQAVYLLVVAALLIALGRLERRAAHRQVHVSAPM